MFTLGIHVKDFRRCTDVLQHSKSDPFDFDFYKQDKDFYIFEFPTLNYEEFKNIVLELKNNGINTLGTDSQLTEKKLMKLTDFFIREQEEKNNTKDNLNRMETAEDVIEKVEEIITDNPDTALDLLEDMIEDFYENQSIDRPDPSMQEQKLKKLIKVLVKEWQQNEQN